MASKLRVAPGMAVVVALLLATTACLLVLAATVADARPLKEESSSLSEGDDDVPLVESPAGDIQTVVGSAEHGGGSSGSGCRNKLVMSIDMLGGIKDSGPSPGAGH